MTCIFCDSPNEDTNIEHIIPESFGNKTYVMEKGSVCQRCNSMFSKFEDKALSNSIFAMERARLAIITKKGRNVKGKVEGLDFEGDKKFIRNQVTIKGLNPENFKNYNPQTGIGELHIASFDKSESSTSKLALKMALESLYSSQKKVYKKYDFKELKDLLTKADNRDWPFLMTDFEHQKFSSIPRFKTKYDLKVKCHSELKICEIDEKTLLFKFRFGAISMIMNLLNRQLHWSTPYIENDKFTQIYPEPFRKKVAVKI